MYTSTKGNNMKIKFNSNKHNQAQFHDLLSRRADGLGMEIVDYELSIESVEVNQVVFELGVTYAPYVPAKIDALPEDCYPEEGGELEGFEFEAAYIMEWEEKLPHYYGNLLFNKYIQDISDQLKNGNTL